MIVTAILPTLHPRRYIVIGQGVDAGSRFYVKAADGRYYKQQPPIVVKDHWFSEIVIGAELEDPYGVHVVADGRDMGIRLRVLPRRQVTGYFAVRRRAW